MPIRDSATPAQGRGRDGAGTVPTLAPVPARAFDAHDHSHCAHDALVRAESLGAAAGARLTPVRRRTLEILLESHRAMGAYELLDRLGAEGFGRQPPVAYRALDFLVDHGLAHRVGRLNAFVACTHPGAPHHPALLICQGCNAVAECASETARAALDAQAEIAGFQIGRTTIEALGLCAACRAATLPAQS